MASHLYIFEPNISFQVAIEATNLGAAKAQLVEFLTEWMNEGLCWSSDKTPCLANYSPDFDTNCLAALDGREI